MNSKIKRNIRLDYINTFITNLNMQSSIWVLYLAYCGMNLLQIGLLEGIFHATSIICEIPSGALADIVGRKKSIILGRLCIAVSCIIMMFAGNFRMFALSFIIQALGYNFNSGSEEALVYDSMLYIGEQENYIKVNGRINVICEVSQAIATVAGGIMAEYSYMLCYGCCVAIALLNLVPIVFMTEPPISVEKEDKNVVAKHFKTSIEILKSDKRILKIMTYFSVIFAAHTVLFFYSQQYYYDNGFNKIHISIVMLFAGVTSCLGAMLSEKLYKNFENKIVVLSAVVIAITFICYGFDMPVVSVIMFVISGFCNSLLYPVESDLLNSIIPSQLRATLISVNSMFFSVVMIIMFPLVGAMADIFGLTAILVMCGGALLALNVSIECKHLEGK